MKLIPRMPFSEVPEDFEAFSGSGELSPKLGIDPWLQYLVNKMTFAKPTADQKAAGFKADKPRIIYNAHLTLDGIPLEAYDYVVNGKPALEWIIERYQITIDKASGIKNDPNDWCKEHNNPRYIVDLLKRVTPVSLETMKIVNTLPGLNEV